MIQRFTMLRIACLCIIMFSYGHCSLGQMKKMLPELERSTILGACRTMCLNKYAAGLGVQATYYWECQKISECRKCWDSCQIFSIGGPTDRDVCTGSCKEVEKFYSKRFTYPVKMQPNLPRLHMSQKEEFVELDIHDFAQSNKVTKQTFIYSLFMVKPEAPEDSFFIDQYTYPNVGLPYYNESVTIYFVVSTKFTIVAYGTIEFIPPPREEIATTEMTGDLAAAVLETLVEKKDVLQRLLNDEDVSEPLVPSYPVESLNDEDDVLKERMTREHEELTLKGYHWNLKADEVRRTNDGFVEVQLRWNPFPATGTYMVIVSSSSKRTTFKALDRAAIFSVVPGEIYNVQVEFRSKKNDLVSLTSPILVIDTIRNTVKPATAAEKKEKLEKYAVLTVSISSVVLIVIIYLIVMLFLKFYRKNQESRSNPQQYVMEVIPGKTEQVETVEMTYEQSVPASLKKKHPGHLDPRNTATVNGLGMNRPHQFDHRMTFAVQLTPVEEQPFVFPDDRVCVARTYSLP